MTDLPERVAVLEQIARETQRRWGASKSRLTASMVDRLEDCIDRRFGAVDAELWRYSTGCWVSV